MYRLFPLASSSKGNAVYIGSSDEGILIDAGIGPRSFREALLLGGIDRISSVRAVFITHEHVDHIKGLLKLSEMIDVPVYGSRETLVEIIHKNAVSPRTKLFEINQKTVSAAGLEIRCFSTSHDSAHSLGYRIALPDGRAAAVCTDLGVVTPEVHKALTGCDTVMLESNYDRVLLRDGPYPAYLKMRIASDTGHLSNDDCAAELIRLASSGTRSFILGHLSEENNRPEIAAKTSISALQNAGLELKRDYTLLTAPRRTSGQFVSL